MSQKELEEEKRNEEEKRKQTIAEYGDPGEGYEWASDVDSQGKPIWGKEGEDWDWYYKEDKEAYERGESTLPPLLNPKQIPANYTYEQREKDRAKMLQTVKARLDKDPVKPRVLKKAQRTGGGHMLKK